MWQSLLPSRSCSTVHKTSTDPDEFWNFFLGMQKIHDITFFHCQNLQKKEENWNLELLLKE